MIRDDTGKHRRNNAVLCPILCGILPGMPAPGVAPGAARRGKRPRRAVAARPRGSPPPPAPPPRRAGRDPLGDHLRRGESRRPAGRDNGRPSSRRRERGGPEGERGGGRGRQDCLCHRSAPRTFSASLRPPAGLAPDARRRGGSPPRTAYRGDLPGPAREAIARAEGSGRSASSFLKHRRPTAIETRGGRDARLAVIRGKPTLRQGAERQCEIAKRSRCRKKSKRRRM